MAYSSLGHEPTVISHNTKGLNIPEKRTAILKELRKGRPRFVFLQETHFKTNQVPKLTDSYFTQAFHATNDLAKSKGVSIFISGDASFELTESLIDPEGRFLFLKGKCNGTPITLANLYFPNTVHLSFCQHTLDKLKDFGSGCLIVGGDFNVPLNPLTDTSTGKTYITYKILKRIKTLLHSLQLVDTWRFTHPEDKDYTFYSIPHSRYSRIDYIFILQKDLDKISGTHIGIQTLSDHAPISLTLNLSEPPPKSNTWRLNSSLLTDPTLYPQIVAALADYFVHNVTPDMNPMTIWEAHKCTIRGELIRLGAQSKKNREKEIKTSNYENPILRIQTQTISNGTISIRFIRNKKSTSTAL